MRVAAGGPEGDLGRGASGGDRGWLGGEAEVGEDGSDNGGVGDRGQDPHGAGAAGAHQQVLTEDPAVEFGPRQAGGTPRGRRRAGRVVGMRRGDRAAVAGNEGGDGGAQRGVGREDTVVPRLILARRGDQRGQATEKGDRAEHELGLAGEPRPAQAVRDVARRSQAQALVGERRARAVSKARSP